MVTVSIGFPGVDDASANQLCGDLELCLREDAPPVQLQRQRTSAFSQDLGTVLTIILGAEASVIVARAIWGWAVRNNQARLVYWKGDQKFEITGLTSKDMKETVAAIAQALRSPE